MQNKHTIFLQNLDGCLEKDNRNEQFRWKFHFLSCYGTSQATQWSKMITKKTLIVQLFFFSQPAPFLKPPIKKGTHWRLTLLWAFLLGNSTEDLPLAAVLVKHSLACKLHWSPCSEPSEIKSTTLMDLKVVLNNNKHDPWCCISRKSLQMPIRFKDAQDKC